jgi:hypothetical protein
MRTLLPSVLGISILAGSSVIAAGPVEPVEIPLEEIWALANPGTRNLRELGSPRVEDSFVEKVLKQIRESWRQETGLVVEVEGGVALRKFHQVRVERLKRNTVRPDVPLTLVFFTNLTMAVHLDKVARTGNTFTVEYRFVPHREALASQQLALIPLGELAAGKYRVNIVRLPIEQKYIDNGLREPNPKAFNNVCTSFDFGVFNQR